MRRTQNRWWGDLGSADELEGSISRTTPAERCSAPYCLLPSSSSPCPFSPQLEAWRPLMFTPSCRGLSCNPMCKYQHPHPPHQLGHSQHRPQPACSPEPSQTALHRTRTWRDRVLVSVPLSGVPKLPESQQHVFRS